MESLLQRLMHTLFGMPLPVAPSKFANTPVLVRRAPRGAIASAPAFDYDAMRAAFDESANFDPPPRPAEPVAAQEPARPLRRVGGSAR